LLGDFASALYWCNPLVWLLTRRQTMERERACDDRALASGVDPTQYGMLLLDVARAAYGTRLPASVLMMARPKELESRLLAIMSGTVTDRGMVSRRGFVSIALLAALLGTAVAAHSTVQSVQSRALEPDRRGDSLAHPMSEVIPVGVNDYAALLTHLRASPLWTGPDSALVRQLAAYAGAPLDTIENGPRRAMWLLLRARGDRIVPDLIATLADRDWRAQTIAAWALTVGHEHGAVPGLIQQLEHPVWRVRAMAAAALQHLGDSTALPALVRVLSDEAWQVRTPAVEFVAQHAEPDAAFRLIAPRLRDRHVAVRRAASEALEALEALASKQR
jgi:hypothetical protein